MNTEIPPTDPAKSVRLWNEFFARCEVGEKERRAIMAKQGTAQHPGYGKH